MEISVLDKQTIQCILTEEEIADYGMDKKALFQNDSRVQDFFRQIMRRAQQETGFLKMRGNVAVHAAFLPDELLEITFSAEHDADPEIQTVVLKSKNLMNLIAFCAHPHPAPAAQLYKYKGVYFLLADISAYEMREAAVFFCLADEYVDALCCTLGIAAYLREHGKCIIENHAIEALGKL